MSNDFIKGIEYAIDTIKGSIDNPALNIIPSKMALSILVSGLNQDIQDMINVGG